MKRSFLHNNTYSYASKKPAKQRLLVILLVVVIFGALVARFMGGFVVTALVPFWAVPVFAQNIGQAVFDKTRTKNSLIEELNRLRSEVAENATLRLTFDAVEEENRSLRLLLGDANEFQGGTLSAVLTRPSQSPYDIVLIEGGDNRGFSVGDLVYSADKNVIGEIIEIFGKYSKVRLFSSSGLRTPVLVGNENYALVAVGKGGQNFTIDAPSGLNIKEGDMVILPSSKLSVVAIVSGALEQDDATERLIARGISNMQQLRFVLVYKGEKLLNRESQIDLISNPSQVLNQKNATAAIGTSTEDSTTEGTPEDEI